MIDITRACRTCTKNDVVTLGLSQTIIIENSAMEIGQALSACTMSQISEDDGLPQKLCEECIRTLQISYAFKSQVIKSEEHFRQLLQLEIDTKIKCEDDSEIKMEFGETDYNELWDESQADIDVPNPGKEDTKCHICCHTFTNKKKLMKHMATHKIQNDVNAVEDHSQDLIIKQEDDLENLLKIQLEKLDNSHPVYECTECNKCFEKKRSLAMHMKKHKKKCDDKFVCDICSKEFALKPLLKRHLKLHSHDRPYACELCPKKYSRQDQLLDHVKRHQCQKSYVCPHCDKGFTQQGNLQDHIRTHTGENPFLCSECGKGFNNRSNLRQHMFRHTGIKPYSCSMCPKKFSTKAQHKIHMVTHTGEQPFKCELCGAGFTHSNSLKKHQKSHLGLRPYHCESCSSSFVTRDHLKRHNRIHTGEKPYSCKYCSRSYAQSNDLVKHLRVHFGQNIYQCSLCTMKFRLLTELKRHYTVHYQNNEINETNEKDIRIDISNLTVDKFIDLDKSRNTKAKMDDSKIEVYSSKDYLIGKNKKSVTNKSVIEQDSSSKKIDLITYATATEAAESCDDVNGKEMMTLTGNDALVSYANNDMEKKIHNITITFNNDGLRELMPQDFTINIVPLKQ